MPMDMIQHYRLFGAVRLPTKPDIDTQEVFQNSKHAVIAHQGNVGKAYFVIECVNQND